MESLLPHRAPFLLIDAVVERVPGERASARRLLTSADPLLRDECQLSELFLVEVMAQCAGIAAVAEDGMSGMLVAIDGFRVHMPVGAGDSLLVEARVVKRMGEMVKASATVRVGDELRAECELVLKTSGPSPSEVR